MVEPNISHAGEQHSEEHARYGGREAVSQRRRKGLPANFRLQQEIRDTPLLDGCQLTNNVPTPSTNSKYSNATIATAAALTVPTRYAKGL